MKISSSLPRYLGIGYLIASCAIAGAVTAATFVQNDTPQLSVAPNNTIASELSASLQSK